MQIIGRLIFKQFVLLQSQNVHFYKITVVVEMGRKAVHKKMSVFDQNNMTIVSKLEPSTPVKVNYYMSNSGFETVSSLVVLDELQSCSECFMYSIYENTDAQPPPCEGCLSNPVHERISGEWVVKAVCDYLPSTSYTVKDAGFVAKRVILQQGTNLLGFISFPNTPFYDYISTISVRSELMITGWRNNKRHFTVESICAC